MKKLSLTLLLFTMTLSAQKIDRSKNELKSPSGSSRSSSSTSASDDQDDGDPLLNFVDVLSKFVIVIFGDYVKEDHLGNGLTAYPYFDSKSGNYTADSLVRNKFRIDFEDHYLNSGSRISGNHMKAKIRPTEYFYVQADYRELFERTIDNTTDNLSLMHLNFCYDRLRFENFNLGWNAGISYVGSGVRKAGFCYGLSVEYFPLKRISFAASAKWSKVNTHPVNSYELQGRYHHGRFVLMLGFQKLKVATPTYNFISVGAGIYL